MSEKFSNLWLLGKADVEAVDAAPGKFVTGDPIINARLRIFQKRKQKTSRNEGCEKVGFEPETP